MQRLRQRTDGKPQFYWLLVYRIHVRIIIDIHRGPHGRVLETLTFLAWFRKLWLVNRYPELLMSFRLLKSRYSRYVYLIEWVWYSLATQEYGTVSSTTLYYSLLRVRLGLSVVENDYLIERIPERYAWVLENWVLRGGSTSRDVKISGASFDINIYAAVVK